MEIAWVLSVYGAIPASILQQRIEIEIHANHLSIQSIKSKKSWQKPPAAATKYALSNNYPLNVTSWDTWLWNFISNSNWNVCIDWMHKRNGNLHAQSHCINKILKPMNIRNGIFRNRKNTHHKLHICTSHGKK